MKKILTLVLVLAMVLTMLAGCTGKPAQTSAPQTSAPAKTAEPAASAEPSELQTSGKKLRVAVQCWNTSMIGQYIVDKGWDVEEGIPFELVVFGGGPAINEAMAANEWDVAITGGAAVFGMANYDALLIGYHMDGTGANSVIARADDPVFNTKGYNPDYPNVYGDPETVKGATILTRSGTTTQYFVDKWLQTIGVDANDTERLTMDVNQIMTSFKAGEGDYAGCTSMKEFLEFEQNGLKEVATMKDLGLMMLEPLICTKDTYENRYADVVKFIELIYRAQDEILADETAYRDLQAKWATMNAQEVLEDSFLLERTVRHVLSSEDAKKIDLPVFITGIAEFYAGCDMLEAGQVDTVKGNVMTGAWNDAMARFD